MSLDIYTSDKKLNFHIGYIGFSNMRSYFILHYGENLYNQYRSILMNLHDPNKKWDLMYDNILILIGNLKIIVDHSDCDGELTSDECKKLQSCLHVDEEKIRSVSNNLDYTNRIIRKMYEFIDLISYCASNPTVKLIFA